MAPTAKRVARKAAGTTDYLKWIYVIAALAAALFGALKTPNLEMVSLVLLGVAFLYGMFYFKSSDLMNYGLRFLIVKFVAEFGASFTLAGIGSFLTGWFTGWASFLAFATMGMVLRFFYDKYFAS